MHTLQHCHTHNTTLPYTQYSTAIRTIQHCRTHNTALLYTQYSTAVHTIQHCYTHNTALPYTQYSTAIHTIQHCYTHNTALLYTQYSSAVARYTTLTVHCLRNTTLGTTAVSVHLWSKGGVCLVSLALPCGMVCTHCTPSGARWGCLCNVGHRHGNSVHSKCQRRHSILGECRRGHGTAILAQSRPMLHSNQCFPF